MVNMTIMVISAPGNKGKPPRGHQDAAISSRGNSSSIVQASLPGCSHPSDPA
jgi:hypothetical protein